MPSDTIEDLLKKDFEDLSAKLEKDRFTERILFKLGAKRRARLGVVCFAGGLGAAFAASQFMGVVKSVAPALAMTEPEAIATGISPELLATMMLAVLLAGTAFVLRQEI
jgi:hypothetical protein